MRGTISVHWQLFLHPNDHPQAFGCANINIPLMHVLICIIGCTPSANSGDDSTLLSLLNYFSHFQCSWAL
eukprot:5452611-Ditylum_brightwellii.AAC.1